MAVLDDIKIIKPSIQENVINLYIRRAETAIGKYLNSDLDNATIETNYPDAVIQYVLEALNRQGDEGVKISQVSSVQMTYELGISETVKSLLPTPKIKYVTC